MTQMQKTPATTAMDAAYFAQLLAIYDEPAQVLSPLEIWRDRNAAEIMDFSDLVEQIEFDFSDEEALEMTAHYEDEVVEAMADHADEARYAL